MATEKNKKRIVPSPDVTKSDFTIGFSVIDLVEKEVWLVDFSWNVGFFRAWSHGPNDFLGFFQEEKWDTDRTVEDCYLIVNGKMIPVYGSCFEALANNEYDRRVYEDLSRQTDKIQWIFLEG